MTVDFSIRFKQPIPLDQELRVVGRITRDTSRFFEGTGEILLPAGTVAAEGRGKYLKMNLDRIAEFDVEAQEWGVVTHDRDPEMVEI